jgi:ATP-dependent DNA helicase RecG
MCNATSTVMILRTEDMKTKTISGIDYVSLAEKEESHFFDHKAIAVQILIFDDRITVISPGRLPGYVTPQNILSARFSRNSKIVRTLAKYPDPPNKDLGEGLNTAFQRMKDWKLRPPEITEDENYVHVVIPHIALASATDSILEFLGSHATITNRQARDITGIRSENAMKNEFYKLRDAGKLEMVPELKGSAAAWRLKIDH